MNEAFVLSEVMRKLANIIRIGKIVEVDKDKVRVQIGKVTTGWLPIVSLAGNTSAWLPITKGELVAVLAPFGEYAQAFVLRSLHYDAFKTPENTEAVSCTTDLSVEIKGQKNCNVTFEDGIKITGGNATISITDNSINISSGGASINMSDSGISLSFGSSTINLGNNNISLSSGSISTNPPICRCN